MSPHRKRPSPTRINWIFVLLFAVIIIGAFYLLAGLGPKSSAPGGRERITDEATLSLLERSRELEEAFDERVLEGIVDSEDMDVLQRSIALQREFIAALPARDFSAEGRLERLRKKFSEYQGEILAREAERLEAEAEGLEEENPERALVNYRQALDVRRDLRKNHGTSSYNDPAKLSRLQRKVEEMDIRPIYDRSLRLEEEGDRLAARGELVEAVERYAEAAELQEEINRGYPDLALAEPLRASRLREKEAEVLSGQLKRRVDDLVDEADDLLYDGAYDEAASVFARARELQRTLTLEYPQSPYASRAREERLRVRQQNAAGFSDYEGIRGLEAQLNEALFSGAFDEAALLIGRLANRLDEFELRYSLSTLPIDTLVERVSYLGRKRSEIRSIHSAVNNGLLPVPGEAGALLFASETPQFLYELVMDANPSRNPGPDSPVETVSVSDVELFLERMEWLLARPARLPTVAEFRAAARSVLAGDDPGIVSAAAGVEVPRTTTSGEPGAGGFYHVLGNVSEFARPGKGSSTAVRIGGSLRMLESQITALEPIPVERGERNRTVGFRFVVEDEILPAQLPAEPEI
jgi:hypothetical protein